MRKLTFIFTMLYASGALAQSVDQDFLAAIYRLDGLLSATTPSLNQVGLQGLALADRVKKQDEELKQLRAVVDWYRGYVEGLK